MQVPYASWFAYELTDPTTGQIRAYEHEVSVLLPYRRHLRHGQPQLVAGSPSVVIVGEETRHGTELAVRRVSHDPAPDSVMAAKLHGELAEAWVFMTMELSSRVDPRWDVGAVD